jgi:hypothetical protein
MHSCVTAPRYDWPEADFPFRQAPIYHCPVTPYRSPRFTKFSPLVPGSGEAARWQKVEINESVNQVLSECYLQSAADIGIRRDVPVRIKKPRFAGDCPHVSTQEHRMGQRALKPFHRVALKDHIVL